VQSAVSTLTNDDDDKQQTMFSSPSSHSLLSVVSSWSPWERGRFI